MNCMAMYSFFSAYFSNMRLYSEERPIFLRERESRVYSSSAYFYGKLFAGLPGEVFLPLLNVSLVYFTVGLANNYWYQFLQLALIFVAG